MFSQIPEAPDRTFSQVCAPYRGLFSQIPTAPGDCNYPSLEEDVSFGFGSSQISTGNLSQTLDKINGAASDNEALRQTSTPVTQKLCPVKKRQLFHPPLQKIIHQDTKKVKLTDKPVVLCAPTGAGKTVIFELAIIRMIMKLEVTQMQNNYKVVYMAPIKALCRERFVDWQQKFTCYGMKCQELTGDSDIDDYNQLQDVNMIFTTPEKWDSMTRKWRDNKFLVQSVSLFLVDEIHMLNDSTRGSTIEAVVSRMKTIQQALSRSMSNSPNPQLRFIAVSATIPNIIDVAHWLGDGENPATHFKLDESYRPVVLRKVILGFPYNENKGSEFRFDLTLSYRLMGIINTYSERKPTLVFCSTRKSTQQAAEILVKDSNGMYVRSTDQRQILLTNANMLKDNKLRDLVMKGVGYHHAGLDIHDRKIMEDLFSEGNLSVLVATSTLAMGVNLPAHLVIVKSTVHYNMGVHVAYSDSEILQMIGRAGRPQFDTSATAVIMTKSQDKYKYDSLVNGTQLIESSLHKNLIEHLNAEIVLHTINDISIAMEWIRYTFLYIRIMKNPRHYGMPPDCEKEEIERKLQDLCMRCLNQLNSLHLITMDEESIDVKPTEAGRLMARYCIAYETMKKFSSIAGTESINDLLKIISSSEEFCEIQLRINEKKTLNMLNNDKNRQTISLIQAALGCLMVQDFSLQQETNRIFRVGQRVTRCLVEFLWMRDNYKAVLSAIHLNKCLRARLWEDSKYVTKQLEGIGPAMSNALVNAGIDSFQKIEEKNPRELELIVNRHPPFGNQLRDSVSYLPKYELTIDQVAKYGESCSEIIINISIANAEKVQQGKTTSDYHMCMLLIGDEDNHVVFRRKILDTHLIKDGGFTKKIEVSRAANGPDLNIDFISQEWVGIDVQCRYTPIYLGGTKRIANTVRKDQQCSSVKGSNQVVLVRELDEGREECNHRCVNKAMCGHECCKHGIVKKAVPTKSLVRTPSVNRAKFMDSYVSDLKNKIQPMPETPRISTKVNTMVMEHDIRFILFVILNMEKSHQSYLEEFR
ncbi:hypothetical protein FSP39_010742 [Pinctada imbricata]|uniref:DNA 3'-5' helicase n=1 Tax=Pinctada imbricata TaxID=66713 RepID=A0AA88XZQ2_PINIB|nr:hypothetical protein FSP39_010742 [Pinctada imbricata]